MVPYVNRILRSAFGLPLTSRGRRVGGPDSMSNLHFEALEPRTMLAGDMAEISGVVLNDLQGDAISANDVAAAGVSVNLFLDGGNDTFDRGAGDDIIAAPAETTDASGRYSFAGIGTGTYFVQVVPSASMHTKQGGDVQRVLITPAEAVGITGRTIDGFGTMQISEASPPLPSSTPSLFADADVLGGQRDMFVQLTEGDDPFSAVSLISGGGMLRLASDTTVTGNARVIWDGVDANAENVNPTGLGGVDLSTFEGKTMTGISLTVGADHPNTIVKLKVYTDANNWSEFTTTVPETSGGAATKNVVFQYADMPSSQSGSGARFDNVGAIELTFEGVSAVDGQVSVIGQVGLTPKTADFTLYQRMSIGDHVWAELVNDGVNSAQDFGIPDVQVNLFADSNDDNQFSPGIDQLQSSVHTDDNGDYLFQDLFPGKYVVQVDDSNFTASGPLAALRTSSASGAAADPDDNQNNDDNGDSLAGHGVVSRAVTLIADQEPTSDGDADPNSNLSIDFGFFGFDLALDKSVQEQVAVPGEELHFSVVVTNSGPTTAQDVTFIDTLPDQVRLISAVTSNGATVAAGPDGKLTANLGDLATGATVSVTIVADVDPSARGSVTNTAEVSATDELDLTNNSDVVTVPIEPRIDLAISKVDSTDPVDPGSTISYEITALNHGPSEATGVVISDILPADGVSFVSATPPPSSISDDKVIFNVGNLASGESTSVTINIQVDAAFSGVLYNEAWIEAKETESTLENNHDDEETRVVLEPASISGTVFVDRDDDGILDAGEARIPGVTIELVGTNIRGESVALSTQTAANGSYRFDELIPGTYRVSQVQPTSYLGRTLYDGKDQHGENGDGVRTQADGFKAPDLNANDDHDSDTFEGISLGPGNHGFDYNFGELMIGSSKADFIHEIRGYWG